MEWTFKNFIIAIIIGTLIAYLDVYLRQHYAINNYSFICNDDICEITNFYNERVVSKKEINKNNIDHFESRLEFPPRRQRKRHVIGHNYWNSAKVHYIYVVPKTGRSFKLSPLYYYSSMNPYKARMNAEDAANTLNKGLKEQPININFSYE